MNQTIKDIFIVIVLPFLLIGAIIYSGERKKEQNKKDYPQPTTVFKPHKLGVDEYILVDKETGVQYICLSGYNSLALSVRVDADGKPIVGDYNAKQ